MVARNTQVYSEIELQSQAPAKIWLNFAKLVSDYAPIKLKKFLGNAGVVPSLKMGQLQNMKCLSSFLDVVTWNAATTLISGLLYVE